MEVYVSPEVAGVEALHPYLKDEAFRALPVREQLEQQAKTVRTAHELGDRRVLMHLRSWWPAAQGKSADDVMLFPVSRDDARLAMAREHGFKNWSSVNEVGDSTADPEFECSLDDLLSGDIDGLLHRLDNRPDLTTQRSHFGHQATLLHYLGACSPSAPMGSIRLIA